MLMTVLPIVGFAQTQVSVAQAEISIRPLQAGVSVDAGVLGAERAI